MPDHANPLWFQKALRRERFTGIILGLALAAAALITGILLCVVTALLWPAECDGIGNAPDCAIHIIGTEHDDAAA